MIVVPNIQAQLRDLANNDVWTVCGSGAPTNGTSGTGAGLCGPGSEYRDYTNANFYINANTKASPTWKLVTRAA